MVFRYARLFGTVLNWAGARIAANTAVPRDGCEHQLSLDIKTADDGRVSIFDAILTLSWCRVERKRGVGDPWRLRRWYEAKGFKGCEPLLELPVVRLLLCGFLHRYPSSHAASPAERLLPTQLLIYCRIGQL